MRYRTADGTWAVDVIRLEHTGHPGRDGEWLRVKHYGIWEADVRTPAELDKVVPLVSLHTT